jgi:hypothetical protein
MYISVPAVSYIRMSKQAFCTENWYRWPWLWFLQHFDQSQLITNIDHLLFVMGIALFVRIQDNPTSQSSMLRNIAVLSTFQLVCDYNVTPIFSDNKLGKTFSYSCKYGTYFIHPGLMSCQEQKPRISHKHNTDLHFMNLCNVYNLVEHTGPWIKWALSLV